MLSRSVPERALGALFGGEGVATLLHEHLAAFWKLQLPEDAEQSKLSSELDLKLLCKALNRAVRTEIDDRTGRRYRLNEVELAVSELCGTSFLRDSRIAFVDDLVRGVLDANDGVPHFRDQYVQRYAEVLSEIDPALLVGWHLATQGPSVASVLERSVAELRTLFVSPTFFDNEFAEGHVHINGLTGDGLVLAQLVLNPKWPPRFTADHHLSGRLRRIRRMLMACVGVWKQWSSEDGSGAIAHQRGNTLLASAPDGAERFASNPTIDWRTLGSGLGGGSAARIDAERPASFQSMLRRMALAAADDDLQQAWIWMFILIWKTYHDASSTATVRAVMLLLVVDIMVLRRQMMMDGNGLRRFVSETFFNEPRTAAKHSGWKETQLRDSARRLFAAPGDQAEIKVAVEALRNERCEMSAFASAAHGRIVDIMRDVVPEPRPVPHEHSRSYWHFCATFSREAAATRASLWESAEILATSLRSRSRWSLDRLDPRAGFALMPADLIRGLDVVGDETRNGIEMFAPMLRWLRQGERHRTARRPSGRLLSPPTVKLHLSVHVGEDYAHPLSGLRHVDETVRFCGMRGGDRLGHALALGILPRDWLARHGDALLSVDDHVDNLIWARHEAVALKRRGVAVAKRVLKRLELRIFRLLPHVSWCPDLPMGFTLAPRHMRTLYRAWRLRQNCIYKALLRAGTGSTECHDVDEATPDIATIRASQRRMVGLDEPAGLYIRRAQRLIAEADRQRILEQLKRFFGAQYKPPRKSQEKAKRVRQIRVTVLRHGHAPRRQTDLESLTGHTLEEAAYLHDHDDADDLEFMHAVQDACIERYAKLGLSIETNPSSNVYIGQLETHSDHPIYRWNPPRETDLKDGERFNRFNLRTRPMPVTINTDDPGMIPTTLRMEHHLMHEGAIDRGYTVEEADNWIEQLRLHGLKLFKDAH